MLYYSFRYTKLMITKHMIFDIAGTSQVAGRAWENVSRESEERKVNSP